MNRITSNWRFHMKRSTATAVAAVAMAWSGVCRADLTPAPLFQHNMVLQQGMKLPVWGTATPGVTVTVEFGGRKATTTAGADGRWRLQVKPLAASAEPGAMTLSAGTNTLSLTNVLVGEVWICSGQSNMEWPMGAARDADQEAGQATYPAIRMFTVGRAPSAMPQTGCQGSWTVCSPDTVKGFSAVGYFFARNLHLDQGVPVGMVNASWGGTAAEPWTAIEELRKLPYMKARLESYEKAVADYTANQDAYEQKRLDAQKAYEEKKAAWDRQNLEADAGARERWSDPSTKTDGWKEFQVPMKWESNVLNRFIGLVWTRKEVAIPEAWVGRDLVLHLGPVDDFDVTYVNGEAVGTSPVEKWNASREYRVPAALNRSAKLTVAVRLSNLFGAVGLYGTEKDYWIRPDGEGTEPPVGLAGTWPYATGLAIDLKTMPRPPPPGIPGATCGEPATLFNSMIAPLAPYAIRGAIWYQGEANAGQPVEYATLLPAMIRSWRRTWGQGDFAFGIVQLANFMARQRQPVEPSSWADLRDSQTKALKASPRTGLAVTIDIGEAADIHPRNKQDVGRRLALWALAQEYGRKIEFSGPMYRAMKVRGREVSLRFDHAGGGLASAGQPLAGFAVAGEDKVFHLAQARIEGKGVVVASDRVERPVAVRYAWANNPICNLYNAEGLPACPFRTDDWPIAEVKAATDEKPAEVVK